MELQQLLNVCRLCLKHQTSYLELFTDTTIYSKVQHVFSFSLEQTESLSALICLACYEHVLRFHDYSRSVHENQTHLETLLVSESNYIVKEEPKPDGEHFASESDVEQPPLPPPPKLSSTPTLPAVPVDVSSFEVQEHRVSRKAKGDQLIKNYLTLRCELCDTMAETFRELLVHYQLEHNTRGYAMCCGKKFQRRDRLLTHIVNHLEPEAFKCDVCGQMCKSQTLLQNHRKQHLPNEAKPFACGHCLQRFAVRSQLTNHAATHLAENEKQHQCGICGKAFALKFVLTKHLLTHNAQRKEFVCEICAKGFTSKAHLQVHLASHDEGKPKVQCPVCRLWYKNESSLRTHVRACHKDGRQHWCLRCDKQFATRSGLTSHTRYVHVRLAPFPCTLCSKQFRRKLELREHMSRHDGNGLYHCTTCQKQFFSSSNYFAHRKTQHRDTVAD